MYRTVRVRDSFRFVGHANSSANKTIRKVNGKLPYITNNGETITV